VVWKLNENHKRDETNLLKELSNMKKLEILTPRHPTNVTELPDVEFFVILYPESNHYYANGPHDWDTTTYSWRMEVFTSEDEWKKEIVRLQSQVGYNRKEFKAAKMIPAKVTTVITVE
jgi:hypothetical protein